MLKLGGEGLLDSSLIVSANKKIYNLKLIHCKKYIQIYKFPNSNIKKDDNLEDITKDIKKINTDDLKKERLNNIYNDELLCKNKENKEEKINEKIILPKNIMRSKLECQRLAKANSDDWRTFITLTFAENITDLDFAYKKYSIFISSIKRVYKDFKCIAVPEFQKRGAVHFHLLTNIDINDKRFIYAQEDNEKFKHIKYWQHGFTKVDNVVGDIKKISGYISKYMTKDIDNRLFSKHRYYYTKNIVKPEIQYLNLDNLEDFTYLQNILKDYQEIYSNVYLDYYNEELLFKEYLATS